MKQKKNEKRRKKVSGKDFSSKIGEMSKDAGGFGFLGIVGAILFAITGLVAGIIAGIVDSFKLLTALTDKAFGEKLLHLEKHSVLESVHYSDQSQDSLMPLEMHFVRQEQESLYEVTNT